jgi:hypothetical protein
MALASKSGIEFDRGDRRQDIIVGAEKAKPISQISMFTLGNKQGEK